SYEDRAKRVSRSLVEILNAAGVSFAILGTEETCNGDSARRMGNEYLFQTLAQQNIETLNGYGVKSIVTNCPHCFNCLKNEYAPPPPPPPPSWSAPAAPCPPPPLPLPAGEGRGKGRSSSEPL